jgi:nucleotide-binding universal stress UspA family protein
VTITGRSIQIQEPPMNRPILVPLDGSALAELALPYAMRLAEARKAHLILFRAVLAGPPSGMDWERQQLDAIDEAQSYITRIAQDATARAVTVETVVTYGPAAREILAVSRDQDVSEIVMATHGRSGLSHLLSGSVAEAVLAETSVPVFLVHGVSGEAPPTVFDPDSARIVVPLDGSEFAEAAVALAQDIAGPRSELILLRVTPHPEGAVRDETGQIISYMDQLEADLRREAADYLEGIVGQLASTSPGLSVRTVIRVGEPATSIASVVVEKAADLVVMATHGRTGITRAVMGSVAGKVLLSGSTPVLLVRPPNLPSPSSENDLPVDEDTGSYTPMVTF